MTRPPLIPPSPSEAEHQAHDANAEPLPAEGDPMDIFVHWLEAAGRSELSDPNAMTVATVDADGMPDGAHRAAEGDR